MKKGKLGMILFLLIVILLLVLDTPAWATKRLTWNSSFSAGPAIAVDTHDNIYAVWYDDAPGSSEIYYRKSTDGGSTWTASKRLTWAGSGATMPAIACDSNDYVYIVYYDASAGDYEIRLKQSRDGGTSWISKRLTWTAWNSADPDIVIDSNDHIHLVWHEGTNGIEDIYYKKSTDNGDSWTTGLQLTSNTGYSLYPSIATDSNNDIHIVWRDGTPGYEEIFYLKSTDGGTTWTSKRLTWAKTTLYDPDIAIDSNDNLYLVWSDGGNIYGKKSTNGGTSWSTRKLTWTLGTSMSPAITISPSSDHIHLVWQEAPYLEDFEILHKVSTDSGVNWTNTRLSWNTGDSDYPAVAVDSSDHSHVVWQDKTPSNYEIFYAKK
jgi:hypothetical protein